MVRVQNNNLLHTLRMGGKGGLFINTIGTIDPDSPLGKIGYQVLWYKADPMPDLLTQMQNIDRGLQLIDPPVRHYGLTANEWGVGLRTATPRPSQVWKVLRPEEEEEPDGLLKWYIRGLKPHDDPCALISALADSSPHIKLLKSTAHGLLLSSLMPLPFPLLSVLWEDGLERSLLITPANHAARLVVEGNHGMPTPASRSQSEEESNMDTASLPPGLATPGRRRTRTPSPPTTPYSSDELRPNRPDKNNHADILQQLLSRQTAFETNMALAMQGMMQKSMESMCSNFQQLMLDTARNAASAAHHTASNPKAPHESTGAKRKQTLPQQLWRPPQSAREPRSQTNRMTMTCPTAHQLP